MELHNPTYNNETNKIVAYLLPCPKLDDYDNLKSYSIASENNKNSRIETEEVDDELRKFIHEKYMYEVTKSIKLYDITPIMDRIEIKKHLPKLNVVGQFKKCTYTAKIKQVDKVEDNEAILFAEFLFKEMYSKTLNIMISSTERSHFIKSIYELFKNQK